MLKPLGDRVVIRVLEQEEKTVGGIYLPDTAKEKPCEGEIIAAGRVNFRKMVPALHWMSKQATKLFF